MSWSIQIKSLSTWRCKTSVWISNDLTQIWYCSAVETDMHWEMVPAFLKFGFPHTQVKIRLVHFDVMTQVDLAYVSGKLKCFHYLVFGDNSSEFRSNCKKTIPLLNTKKSEIKFKQVVYWCSTHTFDTKNRNSIFFHVRHSLWLEKADLTKN